MFEGMSGTAAILIGLLTVASVLQAAALAVVSVVVFRQSRRVASAVEQLERRMPPFMARADEIAELTRSALTDVKSVTALTAAGATDADRAIRLAVDVAALASGAVRASAWRQVIRVVAVFRGLRAAQRHFTRSKSARSLGGPPLQADAVAEAASIG